MLATLLIGQIDLGALLLVLVMSLSGLCSGMVMPSRDLIVREVTPPGAFGRVFAFVTTGYHIAGILAPLVFAALLDHGAPRAVFIVVAAFTALAICAVASVPKRERALMTPLRALLAALARGRGAAADHPCGAAGHSAHPRRPAPVGNADRHPVRTADGAVRRRRHRRLADDRAARRAERHADRPRAVRGRVGPARRRPERRDALFRHHRHGVRRRRDAAVAAAAGSHLGAAAHRLCHRGLHQRPVDRRDPARGADHPAGAADAASKLAVGLRILGRAGRRHRRNHLRIDAARAGRPRRRPPAGAGCRTSPIR